MKHWMPLLVLVALALPTTAHAARMPVDGLTVHYEACPDFEDGGSCSSPGAAEIWIAPDADRFDFWHEVGHVFDDQVLDERARAWFTSAFRFPPGTSWVRNHDTPSIGGLSSPDEVFADAFAACWLGIRAGGVRRRGVLVTNWKTSYGYLPTVRQHRRICNAIAVYALL